MKVTGRPFCAQMPPATMVPLVKEYAVGAGLATPAAIEAGYGQIPGAVLPLFFAMCLGATLGGNATLLGPHPTSLPAASARRTDAR